MLRRADRTGFHRRLSLRHHSIRDFLSHLFEQHPQMRVRPEIGGRDMFHAVGMGGELIALPKTDQGTSVGPSPT
jgi:hypothetical protein